MLLLTLSAPARFQTIRLILEFSKEAEDLFCFYVRCCFVRQIATVTKGTQAKQGVTFASFRVKYQLTWVNVAVSTHVFQSRFPVGEPSVSNGFEDGIESCLLVDTKLLFLSQLKFFPQFAHHRCFVSSLLLFVPRVAPVLQHV